MNDEPARILAMLVSRYGTSVALDPLRCEGLLRDTCPRCSREIFILVNAVRQRVTADLLEPRHSLPPELFRGFLVKRLQDELGLSDEAAKWAVATWAFALGLEGASPLPAGSAGRNDTLPSPGPGRETSLQQREAWADDLESISTATRLSAIRQIAGFRDPESLRLLVTGLGNSARPVREAAFDALVAAGEPAVPVLAEALQDPSDQIVIPAAIALGATGSRAAAGPLLVLLDAGGTPAVYAAWALGAIGDPRAVTPLAKLLNDDDPKLRSAAEEALRKLS